MIYFSEFGGGSISSSDKWRLLTTATQTASNATAVTEMEWRATVGGANQFTGGTPSANSAATGATVGSMAFDGNASTFWSSSGNSLPTWLEYDTSGSITGDELVIRGYSGAEANNPKTIQFQLWNNNSSSWQDFIVCSDVGLFGKDGTKYLRKTANEIWLKELQTTHNGSSTSYLDARATMAVRVSATANVVVEAVTVWHRTAVGGTYQPIIYELNSSNQFVAETAAGPVSSAAGSVAVADRVYPLSSPVTLVSGTKYAIGIRRTDGTNTSNPDCHFFNGSNSYRTVPLTIQDVYTLANKSTPAVGTASASTNGSPLVWVISVIYKQASGTLS